MACFSVEKQEFLHHYLITVLHTSSLSLSKYGLEQWFLAGAGLSVVETFLIVVVGTESATGI